MKKITIMAFITMIIHGETFYIIPPGGYDNGVLFTCVEKNDIRLNRDNCVKHFYDLRTALRKNGHDLKTTTVASLPKNSIVITSGIPVKDSAKVLRGKAHKIIAFIWEPLTVEPTSYSKEAVPYIDKVYTMWDDEVDNLKYFKLFYPNPYIYMIEDIVPFNKKNLLTFISSNKRSSYNKHGELYSERLKAIDFFKKSHIDFTFYGKGWPSNTASYGGIVSEKRDVLKNYKYCICFENTKNMNGYITEKIFDCFNAGCIPIYLGAPNITEYVPADCFIDMRNFKNYNELLMFIMQLTEKEYEVYIQKIRDFLQSDKAQRFSIPYFVDSAIKELLTIRAY